MLIKVLLHLSSVPNNTLKILKFKMCVDMFFLCSAQKQVAVPPFIQIKSTLRHDRELISIEQRQHNKMNWTVK